MGIQIREMHIEDYDRIIALWNDSEGIGLSSADSREEIHRYLKHNPRLSFIAEEGSQIVGAVLCGHDGRRGYIHHLAVNKAHRRKGIGKALVDHCLQSLELEKISRCHIFVYADNPNALKFWEDTGWFKRNELVLMSINVGEGYHLLDQTKR